MDSDTKNTNLPNQPVVAQVADQQQPKSNAAQTPSAPQPGEGSVIGQNPPQPAVDVGQSALSTDNTSQTASGKPTVLLVEDDSLLIKMYKAKFESEGFNLLTAEDGEAGLQIATTKKPGFIILDVMMPKMSGLDVLEKLRQNSSTKDTGVLVLSNLSQEKEAKRALELGAKEYILKASLTPTQLIDKVRKYMA